MEEVQYVDDGHHIYVWNLDDHRIAFEAHVVVATNELQKVELIKAKLKKMLKDQFKITHSTLEFEYFNESK